ncbi:hypothetical protein MKK55_28865 [Methylobacterium sp. J-059]|uniref:hypothetical protein n=1 Tax=Methylobacterium sp. J-059 TaxID=2836643 RepID=UPI001FBA3226|nr:hypothetical protein [Methylobacterium sp. J-059]MCJ2042929.1 hypothetical protein [Methylobacterium sp. J-059]
MAHLLETAGLPPLLETVMLPWMTAVETGTLGMRQVVTSAASSTAASLKRRVVVVPALDMAIAEAVVASVAFAAALDQPKAGTTEPRAAALAALMVLIGKLHTATPSEDTRALGLGW